VNVASRIESIAEPGSVYVSEAVYGAVKGREGINAIFQGEKKLKNVEGSVRVYRIIPGEIAESRIQDKVKKYLVPTAIILLIVLIGIWRFGGSLFDKERKTIMVLPFELVNPDSTNEHLVLFTTRGLITNLGKVKSLMVINQMTSLTFQASVNPLSDARDKLTDIDYFARGSIETRNNRIIFKMRLYDTKNNEIWSSQYDEDLTRIPLILINIAVDISENIRIKVNPDEIYSITELKPIDPEIYQLWMKAWNEVNKTNPEAYERGRVYFNEAVEKSPADSRTWSQLATGLIIMGHSTIPIPGIWQEAKSASLRALQLDSLNPWGWITLAVAKTYGELDYEGALYAYERANSINPNIGFQHSHYAWFLFLYDRMDEAIIEHTKAQKLEPLGPGATAWLGWLYAHDGQYENAIREAKRAFRIVNECPLAYITLGKVYEEKGLYDSAIYYYEKFKWNPSYAGKIYLRKGEIEKGMEIIEHYKKPPLNSYRAFNLALLYSEIDSLDQFFRYASYEPLFYEAPYFRKFIDNPKIFEDPRFKQLMDKMNLPMPEGYE
jgi:adenylate cyclase